MGTVFAVRFHNLNFICFTESLGNPASVRRCWLELRSTEEEKQVTRECIRKNMPLAFVLKAIRSESFRSKLFKI